MQTKQPFFLYVEDDASSREILEVLLTNVMGFTRVASFETSASFLDNLDSLPSIPDVIFLDIHIKPHDGCELFEMIRQVPKYRETILVALTASVMSNEVERIRNTGFKYLIGKPINPITFPDKVNSILAGKEVWDVSWD